MRPTPRLRLHLGTPAESAVRCGHPWVFAHRVREQNRQGSPGELAALYDRRNRFLGLGLFDPESTLRVRVLHVGPPVVADDAWWHQRLQAPVSRRAQLFDLRSTTAWRCVHGENDGWPGMVLDRYGDVYVLKLYTMAWLPRLDQLVSLICAEVQPRSLVLRLSRNIAEDAHRKFHRADGAILSGEPITGPVVFLENGLRFEADVVRGQKTGFFLDQRENREIVGGLAGGAEMLNGFSFSGGFSLYAARGGARCVTDLDISPHALAGARRNFDLNHDIPRVSAARHELVQADAFEWLGQNARPSFDVVVLDPPSLARREAERPGALAAYRRLARAGSARVKAGGVLVAASCSAHVPAGEFFRCVREGLQRAQRPFEDMRTTAHPADHPATFPEAHYLKAIYLRLK